MGFLLVFRRYAPFSEFGFGFEGDNRKGPSVSMQATARTIGVVPFERGRIGSIGATSSGTEFLGLGDWVRRQTGKHFSHVACQVGNPEVSANALAFTASTAGSNPMVPLAPTIDTYVDFRVSWDKTGVRFDGTVRGDNFPHAEVFVLDEKGVGCLLFDGRTTGGRNTGPMTRLMGAHASQILGGFHCTMPLTSAGLFASAKPLAPTTTMDDAVAPKS